MKLRSIVTATVAVALSASSIADSVLYNDGNAYQGAVPVGIIVNDSLRNALQKAQLGDDCEGESTAACMPNLNAIEVASIITTNGSQTWDQYGLPAFDAGAAGFGNAVLTCGSPTADDASATAKGATQVAVNEVGMGCSGGALPYAKYNTVISGYVSQSDVAACTSIVGAYGLNLVSFAARSEALPAGFSFTKYNGTAPELANLLSGDYSMFGDVHGDAIASPHFAAAGANVPQHKLNLTGTSADCGPGIAPTADISN